MTDVTKEMIDRFLSWRLPDAFAPDGGISFKPLTHPEWPKGFGWPVGTNLLTHEQAKAMLAHVLGTTREQQAVEALNCWPLKELMQLVLLRGDDDMLRAATLFTEVHKAALEGAA